MISMRNYKTTNSNSIKQNSHKIIAPTLRRDTKEIRNANLRKYRRKNKSDGSIRFIRRKPRQENINGMDWTIKGNPRNVFSEAIHNIRYNASLLSIRHVANILLNAEVRDFKKATGDYKQEYVRDKRGHKHKARYLSKEKISKIV